jgi:prevent-host-death family protein
VAKKQVNLYQAKTHLSALVDEAASGQEIVIARGGRPAAKLVRVDEPKRKLVYGRLKGKVKVAADFDAPLPPELQAAFEGR